MIKKKERKRGRQTMRKKIGHKERQRTTMRKKKERKRGI